MKALKIIPPIYLFSAIAMIVLLHFLFPGTKVLALPWNLLGVFPLSFGIIINLSADRAFKENKTSVRPLEKSDRLITTGAFRISRHPMYLGFAGILLGIAMLMGSLTPYLVFPAFLIFMDAVFIRHEEKELEKTFGEAWLQYRKMSRRCL